MYKKLHADEHVSTGKEAGHVNSSHQAGHHHRRGWRPVFGRKRPTQMSETNRHLHRSEL